MSLNTGSVSPLPAEPLTCPPLPARIFFIPDLSSATGDDWASNITPAGGRRWREAATCSNVLSRSVHPPPAIQCLRFSHGSCASAAHFLRDWARLASN